MLVRLALTRGDARAGAVFAEMAQHSLILAGITAIVAVVAATLLAYGLRSREPGHATRDARGGARLRCAGRGDRGRHPDDVRLARPGARRWGARHVGHRVGLVLSGTLAALILAYLVRFLAAALNTVEASLGKITPSLDEVPRTSALGRHTPYSASTSRCCAAAC